MDAFLLDKRSSGPLRSLRDLPTAKFGYVRQNRLGSTTHAEHFLVTAHSAFSC